MERIDDKILYVFDACNLINLYNIDEDNFLLDSLFRLNLKISEKVFNEVKENIYKKYDLYKIKNISYDSEKRDNIDHFLSRLKTFLVYDNEIKKDIGKCYEDIYKYCILPKKENGEVISTGLSLKLSREFECRVLFCTDDYKARDKIVKFFINNQIGFISDTSELLVYMYWRNANFRLNTLTNYLSSLASEYKSNIKLLHKLLIDYKSNLSVIQRKDKFLVLNLDELINKLNFLQLENIASIFQNFYNKKKKYKELNKILVTFDNVLDLETKTENQITKITRLIQYYKEYELYKLA